jgi:hypothetical protein
VPVADPGRGERRSGGRADVRLGDRHRLGGQLDLDLERLAQDAPPSASRRACSS